MTNIEDKILYGGVQAENIHPGAQSLGEMIIHKFAENANRKLIVSTPISPYIAKMKHVF